MKQDTLIVAKDGSGNFTNLTDALENINVDGNIFIKPGIYEESFVINKNITIKGDSKGMPVFLSQKSSPYSISADAKIINIHFSHEGPISKGDSIVDVTSDAVFDNCRFTNSTSTNVKIHGNSIKPKFKNCTFSDAGIACLFVQNGSMPSFSQCKIYNSKEGIFCSASSVNLEYCKIYNTQKCGVHLEKDSSFYANNCNFFDLSEKGLYTAGQNITFNLNSCKIYNCLQNNDKQSDFNQACGVHLTNGDTLAEIKNTDIYDIEGIGLAVSSVPVIIVNCNIYNCYDDNLEAAGLMVCDKDVSGRNTCIHDIKGYGIKFVKNDNDSEEAYNGQLNKLRNFSIQGCSGTIKKL